jgi:hypothetical protein
MMLFSAGLPNARRMTSLGTANVNVENPSIGSLNHSLEEHFSEKRMTMLQQLSRRLTKVLLGVLAVLVVASCSDLVTTVASDSRGSPPQGPSRQFLMDCTYIGGVLSECHTVEWDVIACADEPSACPGFYPVLPTGLGEIYRWSCDVSGCPTPPPTSPEPTTGGSGSPGSATLPTPSELNERLPAFQCPTAPSPCDSAEQMAGHPNVAAKLVQARQRTAQTGREAGAWIFRNANGDYNVGPLMDGGFGNPPCNNGGHCMPQMTTNDIPVGAVGMLHSHPLDPMPSPEDQQVARMGRIYSYVVSPRQIIAMGPPNGTILWRYTR